MNHPTAPQCFRLVAFLTSALIVSALPCSAASNDATTATVYVFNNLSEGNSPLLPRGQSVLVELYQDRRVVRSTDLLGIESRNSGRVEWTGLPPGEYEFHFTAQGFAPSVKFVTLSTDAVSRVRVEIAQEPLTTGRRPSLDELLRRITVLEESVAPRGAKNE